MLTISIELDINEIIYDIQNKTYLTGKSRRDGSNHEFVANMQANDDEENANQILRSVSTAFANLKTKLGEYLNIVKSKSTNELVAADTSLILGLEMPSNFNTSTADTIAAAAHQYIVAMAVADWFTITDKPDASEYKALADTSLTLIAEAASRRLRPRRNYAEN